MRTATAAVAVAASTITLLAGMAALLGWFGQLDQDGRHLAVMLFLGGIISISTLTAAHPLKRQARFWNRDYRRWKKARKYSGRRK